MASSVRERDPTAEEREGFDRKIRERSLLGYWMLTERSTRNREPEPAYGPTTWRWETIHESLYEAVEYIPREEAYRRFIAFQHPELELGTAPNFILGGQLLLAGECAPPHRHTMDAVRFVVEGAGEANTIVEGEPFPMCRGDLVTTPNWSWHEHISAENAKHDTIWLDGAVVPLMTKFGIAFAELLDAAHIPVDKPPDWSRQQFGPLQPRSPQVAQGPYRPPYRYAWDDVAAALDRLGQGDGDPFDDVVLHYADPVTGGTTLPTLDCEIQRIRPGWRGQRHRHTHAVVYHVFEGAGCTEIGDGLVEWRRGDTVVVPLWTWHRHRNDGKEPAVLFSMTDRPVMQSLGFHREQVEGGPAVITR